MLVIRSFKYKVHMHKGNQGIIKGQIPSWENEGILFYCFFKEKLGESGGKCSQVFCQKLGQMKANILILYSSI